MIEELSQIEKVAIMILLLVIAEIITRLYDKAKVRMQSERNN